MGSARPRSGDPAAQCRVYLALLPSGPDAVRRLNLHRVRTAVWRIPRLSSVLQRNFLLPLDVLQEQRYRVDGLQEAFMKGLMCAAAVVACLGLAPAHTSCLLYTSPSP